uniref:Uncharacterized protein n=1 Tax=Arundo donax TaxID=35708 RepID=A0A0A9FRH1_ARUDO
MPGELYLYISKAYILNFYSSCWAVTNLTSLLAYCTECFLGRA